MFARCQLRLGGGKFSNSRVAGWVPGDKRGEHQACSHHTPHLAANFASEVEVDLYSFSEHMTIVNNNQLRFMAKI